MISDQTLYWTSSGITNPGKTRKLNEDAFLEKPEDGLWVVADGMGGHQAGEIASENIVKSLSQPVNQNELESATLTITSSLANVNLELLKVARERGMSMIGSTAVIMLVRERRFACIWAGDSRLYRLRQGVFKQVNRDHSEIQHLIDYGVLSKADSENHPSANIITRAVGASDELELETIYGDIQPGDKYLLCSDGLYREVSDREMAQSMQFDGEPNNISANLLSLALERTAKDNITLIAINFSGDR